MDSQQLCQIVEAAYRAGMRTATERFAVWKGSEQQVGSPAQPLAQVLIGIDAERLDCYTITAHSPELSRLMATTNQKVKR